MFDFSSQQPSLLEFNRRASATFSESSFLNSRKNENDTTDDFDDELSIPELGSGEDQTLPGLGSMQCLASGPIDEVSNAKPLRPSYLGSVPDGLGQFGTFGSNLDSKIPPRLGE